MSIILPHQRERMKTGSPLDKLEALIPTEISTGRPGPMRRMPIQCCANCNRLKKKQGRDPECNPPGTWYVRTHRGGEITINMPHTRKCFFPSKNAFSEFGNDPWNATSEGIQAYLNTLERFLNRLPDDWTTEDNPI